MPCLHHSLLSGPQDIRDLQPGLGEQVWGSMRPHLPDAGHGHCLCKWHEGRPYLTSTLPVPPDPALSRGRQGCTPSLGYNPRTFPKAKVALLEKPDCSKPGTRRGERLGRNGGASVVGGGSSRPALHPQVPTKCESGCVCAEGLYEDASGQCVPPEQCPCEFAGVSYPAGAELQTDCRTW